MKNAVSTPWIIATIALCVVLLASVVNNVATAVQSQDNCGDIQQIKERLRAVFAETVADLKSGSRDDDLVALYGSKSVKQRNGKTLPRWKVVKKATILQYNQLAVQFAHESCPLPLFGISHRGKKVKQ